MQITPGNTTKLKIIRNTPKPQPEKKQDPVQKPAPPAPPKKRFRKVRVFFWILEIVILLSCLEHFILKPKLTKRKQAAKPKVNTQELGTFSRPLGDKARDLPGLRESVPIFLAPLDGLAQGSESARDAQAAVSISNSLPIEVINSIGMKFRLIPAGTCLIGSPADEIGRESTEVQHVEAFPSHFYLGKFEVTQEQWTKVMGANSNPSGFIGNNRPVEEVSWYDCQRFTHKLCELENLPIGTYRLPTETEWEYACRAGTTTAFCFGNDYKLISKWTECADNNYARTVNVGQKLPNAFGLFDMHGNVWEWCLNDYKNYPGDNSPKGEFNYYPTLRGGNWYVEAAKCRSANRSRLPGASHGNMLGFRVLRQIVQPPKINQTLQQQK